MMRRIFSIVVICLVLTGLAIQSTGNAAALQSAPAKAWVAVLADKAGVISNTTSMIVDGPENIYMIGVSDGTWGSPIRPHDGGQDVFVTKFDRNRNLVWSTFLGGAGSDLPGGISLDGVGNLYVSGVGTAAWEPQASLTPLTAFHGNPDCAFLAKLDSNGHLLWYTFPIAGGRTYASDVKVDGGGNIFLGGTVANSPVWDQDAVVAKLNGAGASQWSTSLGSSNTDVGYKIVLDGLGNILLVGESMATWGASPVRAYTSGHDIFVAMLNGSGVFQWNTFLGGSGDDLGFNLKLDQDGNILVAGRSYAGWGNPVRPYGAQDDAVLIKLEPDGHLIWNTFLGNNQSDEGWDIVLDDANVYFCGTSVTSWGTPAWSHSGGDDAFVASLDLISGALQWHGYLGGGGDDECNAIAANGNGSIYFGGVMSSQTTDSAFLAKLSYQAPSVFTDVPADHPYVQEIQALYANGLTAGCNTNPLKYCPDQVMKRGEAAVFMLRGTYGSGFFPNPAAHIFKDDWRKGAWAETWAEAMHNNGISAGCQASPLKYCPWDKIPREQAVIFALRLKYGVDYKPPAATGTLFADLTNTGYYATAWAEQAYKDGLIPNCGMSGGKPMICPRNPVSRALAAYMIVKAKNLIMP
jgi:hypothetical protein